MERLIRRLLGPIVDVRENEGVTLLMMFAYSFLAMTSYNIVKPLATAKFISDLGADNLPYVLLVAGFVIGIVMHVYTRAIDRLPKKLIIPVTQGGIVALLVLFWFLFQTGQSWASVAVYFFRLIIGILLISQFWTLANDVYDARQAKRLFGFIGGGASLGGLTGSIVLAQGVQVVGTNNLLLVSGAILVVCMVIVTVILRRTEGTELEGLATAPEEKGVGGREALRMLRESRHLQLISLVIAFASMAAFLIETQLNLAAEATQGREATDQIASLLGLIQAYTSGLGFIIQVWLVSKIHRYLGIGVALLVLPITLGGTAIIILLNAAIWAAGLARVVDTSLRYTIDKTTREILFLPLPTDLKYRAKPFVDVTVDRVARGISGVLLLVLIKPWGLGWDWQRLSYASLVMMAAWVFGAIQARKGYLTAFRQTIERRDVQAADMRLTEADLSTIETLIEELSDPDEQRVLYAIDVLDSLDKRNLVTPLLLYHESPRVRTRALQVLSQARSAVAGRWLPNIQAMLGDADAGVRTAAVGAIASLKQAPVTDLIRPLVDDRDPRLASTAAIVLARSTDPADVERAETVLARLASQPGETGVPSRRDAAAALGQIEELQFFSLLIPLLYDDDPSVAEEAMHSVRRLGTANYLFVPTLISLLRNRRLKSAAREVLVGYGEDVVDALRYFMLDPAEDPEVRRHIPSTLAHMPYQKSIDALIEALSIANTGYYRFKGLTAITRLHRQRPDLTFDPEPLNKVALVESTRFFTYLSLYDNLIERGRLARDTLLLRALSEKMNRSVSRIWLVLGLRYPWKDIAASRWAIEHGLPKMRASALEYLDNVLDSTFRKRILPVLEDMPLEEKVRRANVLLRTRPRDVEETLLQLINDEDEIVAAAAIDLVSQQHRTSLADDVEHVLAHRDVRDWFVFEASSWALAGLRMPDDRRRSLWLEPLPAVEIAAVLRRIPAFQPLEVDELFRIARTGRQERYESGRVLYQAGTVPSGLLILLDGRVELTTPHGTSDVVDAPAPLALEETLRGTGARHTAHTTATSVCLSIGADDLRSLLADNTDLVRGLFAMLMAEGRTVAGPVVRVDRSPEAVPAGKLRAIDRVLMLQRIDLFSSIPAEEMLHLAAIAREVDLEQDAVLFQEADSPGCYSVLAGEISLPATDESSAVVAGIGDAVGLYETLAGTPMGRTARVTKPGRALLLIHEDVYDVLGLRPGLLQHFFGALYEAGSKRR